MATIQYSGVTIPPRAVSQTVLAAYVAQAAQILTFGAVCYQGYAAPVMTTTVAPTLAQPIFSDRFASRPQPPVPEGDRAEAISPAFPVRPLSWGPVSGQARAVSSAQYQPQQGPVTFTTATPSVAAWGAEYPDVTAQQRAVRERLQTVSVLFEAGILPDIFPVVEYPDAQLPRRLPILPTRFVGDLFVAGAFPELAPRSYFAERVLSANRTAVSATVSVLDDLTAPRDWDTKYPDRLARVAASIVESSKVAPQAQAAVTYATATYVDRLEAVRAPESFTASPATAAATPTGIAPEYPDFFARAARVESALTRALAPAFPVSALSWAAEYPDRAPGARPLPDWQTFAENISPISVPDAQLGWRGVYPHEARKARTAIETWMWQTFALPPDFTIRTPLTWEPQFPDLLRRLLPSPEGWFASSSVQTSVPTLLAWEPQYQDLVRAALRSIADGVTNPLFNAAVPISWAAEYPDALARSIRAQADGAVYPLVIVAPALSWKTQYPDVLRAALRSPFDNLGFVSPSATPVPHLSWLGRYAERAPGARPLVDWTTFAQNISPLAVPVQQFGWRGSYPDFARIARLAIEAFQWQTFSLPPDFTMRTPLQWQPRYHDVVLAKLVQALPFALNPFPRASAPLIVVEAPDLIVVPRRTPDAYATSLVQTSVPTLLAWAAEFADSIARPAAPQTGLFAQSAVQTAVPTLLAWQAEYADWLPKPAPVRVESVASSPVQTSVPTLLTWMQHAPVVAAVRRVLESLTTIPATAPAPTQPYMSFADRVFAAAQAAVGAHVSVLDRLTVPQAWQPAYPAEVIRRRLLDTAQQRAWTSSTNVVNPVPHHSWHGVWADRAPKTTLPTADVPFEAARGRLFVPAVLTGWQPTYADSAPGARPINVGPAAAFVRLVIRGPEVIHFTAEVDEQPVLADLYTAQPDLAREIAIPYHTLMALDEYVRTAGLTNERVAQPTFEDTNEDT